MKKYEDDIEEEKKKVKRDAGEKAHRIPLCLSEIEHMLEEKKHEELAAFFGHEDVRILTGMDGTLAQMAVISEADQLERQEGVEHPVLDCVNSIREAEEYYLKAKFMLWRLEFRDERQIIESVAGNMISIPFLQYLIHTSSFDKANTAFKIAMDLKERKQFAKAFHLMHYVHQMLPEEELVLCELADICMICGKEDDALNFMRQIPNPTQLLERYRKRWGGQNG